MTIVKLILHKKIKGEKISHTYTASIFCSLTQPHADFDGINILTICSKSTHDLETEKLKHSSVEYFPVNQNFQKLSKCLNIKTAESTGLSLEMMLVVVRNNF